MSNKLLLVDGNSLLFRSFHGIALLTNSKGMYTNAIFGFTRVLNKLIEKQQPTHIMVAFDAGKTTFRHSTYEAYKGGRSKTPSELKEQFVPMRNLLDAYKIKWYELPNYEADDIIGTLSSEADRQGIETIILTGDRDLTQLVSEHVTVFYTTNKKGQDFEEYTIPFMQEKYELTPKQIIDMKGLMGDKSDNIPGVPKIGEKTAIKLLKEYESVENLYEHIDELKQSKMKDNLIEYKEDALMSKALATIETNAPIDVSIEDTVWDKDFDRSALVEMYKTLEFKSLLKDETFSTSPLTAAAEDKGYEDSYNTNINSLNFDKLKEDSPLYIYIEHIEDRYIHKSPLAIALSDGEQVVITKFEHIRQHDELCSLLKDESIEKYVYDAKKVYVMFEQHDVTVKNITMDAMLGGFLLDPSVKVEGMSQLLHQLQLVTIPSEDEFYGKGKSRTVPDQDVLNQYISQKINALMECIPTVVDKLNEQQQLELLKELELPLSKVLASMEVRGIHVDVNTLHSMQSEIQHRIDDIKDEIYSLAGEEFNINSVKELGVILFEKLELPVIKKTKTGYSTAADVLTKLEDKHDIVKHILNYRTLSKLQSTYVEGLQDEIYEDGKIHTRFNQTLAQTGRLSSLDPNLQNIPIRLEEGRLIRKAFKPFNDEYVFVALDYSQIELRVLAHITQDEHLIETFNSGGDIHTETARKVFNLADDTEVDSNLRRQAKAVNFGIVYGISDYGLSENLNIPRKQAKTFIDNYLKVYPNIQKYMDQVILDAKRNGYVETLLNRRRYIPEINSRNFHQRSFAERTAMNTPIQGTAADIIKMAMVKYDAQDFEDRYSAYLLLQIHDELIFEVHRDDVEAFYQDVKQLMENAYPLDVPLLVDGSYGESWYDTK